MEQNWLPNDMWTPATGAHLERVDGELLLRTPAGSSAYAFTYAPLIVPETGRYRVDFRYRPLSGQIAFGAFPADESQWLATDTSGRQLPDGREMSVTLDLKAGDTLLLRIANNLPKGGTSSFVLLDAAVLALAP